MFDPLSGPGGSGAVLGGAVRASTSPEFQKSAEVLPAIVRAVDQQARVGICILVILVMTSYHR